MERRMVRTRRVNSLNTLMNGYLVGTWQNLPSGAMNFQYAEEWLETDGARPISLSMPYADSPMKDILSITFSITCYQIVEKFEQEFKNALASPLHSHSTY